MRKKIRSEAGFGLVEMLAATVVLMLLALMLNTGIQMAFNSYRTMIAKSEVELLMSTAMDALADDLRFAQAVKVDGNKKLISYYSDSFGENTKLEVGVQGTPNEGQIMAKVDDDPPKRFLSTGAYGAKKSDSEKRAYEVSDMEITYENNIFTIKLTVRSTANISISATRVVTVRCLNVN